MTASEAEVELARAALRGEIPWPDWLLVPAVMMAAVQAELSAVRAMLDELRAHVPGAGNTPPSGGVPSREGDS